MTSNLKGIYNDILINSQGKVLWESNWHSNLIVYNCNLLLAALMKRQHSIQGILYLAVGEGEDDWDSTQPGPLLEDRMLAGEIFRQALDENQIVFLDNKNNPSQLPTNLIEVTTELKGKDFVSDSYQSLREFGLFGGDATEAPNSGFMINYIIHPRIDMTPDLTVIRRIRLAFLESFVRQERRLTGLGAALPVISIEGIGEEFEKDLAQDGIRTIADLVQIDPWRSVGDIPQVKLREFQEKARIVTQLQIGLVPYSSLTDRSIKYILMERPESILEATAAPGITLDVIRNLQDQLSILLIAIDDAQLKRITLGELIN